MRLAGSTKVVKDQALELLVIDNSFASASVSLFGGHILSYKPKSDNRERLWLSPLAFKNAVKPIRGGIPVCWPWFGQLHGKQDESLPAHGYVRNQAWSIKDSRETEDGTLVVLSPLTTQGDGFDGKANLTLSIHLGKKLAVTLTTENNHDKPFTFSAALHSYFKVEDIDKVRLSGIDGQYRDKVRNMQTFTTPHPYRIEEETDRVHLCTTEQVLISEGMNQTLVDSQGHDSLVVWNPWQELSENMADMTNDGYRQMICVETAVTQGVTLQPGEKHDLIQTIE